MPNLTENDLLLRIAILELKLEENEKKDEKTADDLDKKIISCNEKIEDVKCKMCDIYKKYDTSIITNLNEELNELEEQVDSIRNELPEIRLTKQIVLGLAAIILTSFVGFMWNSVFDEKPLEKISGSAKKLVNEYDKNGDSR